MCLWGNGSKLQVPSQRRDPEIGKDGLAVVVAGVDGSDRALHAAAWAAGLARREQALLVLVYVGVLASPAYWSPIGMAPATEAAAELVGELRQAAAGYLDPAGVRWELVHYRGDPAHGLEAIAEDRRGGGVARSLVDDARRPVVVVP